MSVKAHRGILYWLVAILAIVHNKHSPSAPARGFVEFSAQMSPSHRQLLPKDRIKIMNQESVGVNRSGWLLETAARSRLQSDGP